MLRVYSRAGGTGDKCLPATEDGCTYKLMRLGFSAYTGFAIFIITVDSKRNPPGNLLTYFCSLTSNGKDQKHSIMQLSSKGLSEMVVYL